MCAEEHGRKLASGYSDGQRWLYRLMQRLYQKSGPACVIPASEIAGLLEYGAAASHNDDQAFWRGAVNEAGNLAPDWYEREAAAEQCLARLGLVVMQADVELHADANN